MLLTACNKINQHQANQISIQNNSDEETVRLKSFASQAKLFCKEKGYNGHFIFLADMLVSSGKKRFFVYDLNDDSVITSSMVAHGCCGFSFLQEAKFSNEPGCGCSSLGKYKIGNKYKGNYGLAYKLYGLDNSNSNAYKRNIVLHSYYAVPDHETFPDGICNSYGCVMVSESFIIQLKNIIDQSAKPILLWIIN